MWRWRFPQLRWFRRACGCGESVQRSRSGQRIVVHVFRQLGPCDSVSAGSHRPGGSGTHSLHSPMPYDLAKAVGYERPAKPVKWNRRDVLLYAVGIGCKATDLNFVYELNQNFAMFPTFPVVLHFRGDSHDVVDFNKSFTQGPVPGLPPLNPARMVHATQSIEILKPLPVEGDGWRITSRIVGVSENAKGIIIETEQLLVDPKGTPYVRMIGSSFNLGAKGNGKPFSTALLSAPKPSQNVPPSRPADAAVKQVTSPEQAIVYRLSGDYNALHIDPEIGRRAGFGGVILHGLGTFGFAARAILERYAGNDANSLKTYGCRFTSPVKPGDELETSIWELGPGPNSTMELGFVTKNLTSGQIVLGNGLAHVIKKTEEKAKL